MNEQTTAKQGSRAGFWFAIVLLSIILLFSIAVNMALLAGMALISGEIDREARAHDEFPRVEERWSYGDGAVKAARIPVTGVITRSRPREFFLAAERDVVESIKRQIRAASNDRDVRAIILEIDSPGGEITAIDEIYDELLSFKNRCEDRKIIAYIRSVAASGGYYVAMASDWIIAEPTAIVGSISAIMQTLNWKELSDRIGVRDVTIKTGENKDLLNPFREVEPEQITLLQEVLDSMHSHFFDIVLEGRSMEPEVLNELADGRVFTVEQALNHQLVDQAGHWTDVMQKTFELLELENVKIVRYKDRPGFLRMFAQTLVPPDRRPLVDLQPPRPMYLWTP